MGEMKTYGFFALLCAGLAGGIFACGAEGSALEPAMPGTTTDSDATVEPVTPSTGKDASVDSFKVVDSGTKDTTVSGDANDAGDARDANDSDTHDSAVDPEGTACVPEGTIQKRACGLCGTESRVCLNTGGGATWQKWGLCTGEVAGGCTPGTTATAACGRCGTLARQCTSTCTWVEGICGNEPANACDPGLSEYVDGLSCGAGAGRVRTCQSPAVDGGAGGCTWGTYSTNCRSPLTTLEVSGTVGQSVGIIAKLSQQSTEVYNSYNPDGGANCEVYSYDAGSTYGDRAALVRVTNPTSKTVVVTIWGGPSSTGNSANDLRIATYDGAQMPPASFANCSRFAEGNCTSYSPCTGVPSAAYAALYSTDGGLEDRVTLAPGASAVIYVADDSYVYSPPYPDSASVFARTDQVK